jgi:hypothetical protein
MPSNTLGGLFGLGHQNQPRGILHQLTDGSAPIPRERPSRLIEALTQYPGLGNPNVNQVYNPQPNPQNYLEYWQPNEPGSADYKRPASLPIGTAGIEITNPATRPIDIAGDLVSHGLVESDPRLRGYYQQFQNSITPQQQAILQDQYRYAKANEGETRPFDEWSRSSGMPAYFRGYAFQQWPQDFNERAYTPEQRQMFDGMMNYLRGGK